MAQSMALALIILFGGPLVMMYVLLRGTFTWLFPALEENYPPSFISPLVAVRLTGLFLAVLALAIWKGPALPWWTYFCVNAGIYIVEKIDNSNLFTKGRLSLLNGFSDVLEAIAVPILLVGLWIMYVG